MWMVLCREGPGGQGRPRIEMYRSEDNVTGCQPLRVIDLETIRCVKAVGKGTHSWPAWAGARYMYMLYIV